MRASLVSRLRASLVSQMRASLVSIYRHPFGRDSDENLADALLCDPLAKTLLEFLENRRLSAVAAAEAGAKKHGNVLSRGVQVVATNVRGIKDVIEAPDLGETTVHWWKVDTTSLAALEPRSRLHAPLKR